MKAWDVTPRVYDFGCGGSERDLKPIRVVAENQWSAMKLAHAEWKAARDPDAPTEMVWLASHATELGDVDSQAPEGEEDPDEEGCVTPRP